MTGHLPARTRRTAREPISRWPALREAPTTIASARVSIAIRVISRNGSPCAAMNVTEMPSSLPIRSARSANSLATWSWASFSAASTLGPPELGGVLAFQRILCDAGYSCFIRRRRGDDVDAACGQLALLGAKPKVRVNRA